MKSREPSLIAGSVGYRGCQPESRGGDGRLPAPEFSQERPAIPTTCIEHAYGSTFRLSFQIKVF